jgi:hypothetical protein
MIKRLLAILLTLGFIACASQPVETPRERPGWVKYYDEKFAPRGEAEIVDWRNDDRMAFLWVDRKDTDRTCDHVAMLEIVNLDTKPPQFASIFIINDETVHPQGSDPCTMGYGIWAKYLENKTKLKYYKKQGGI